jgi:hypothetical protein
MARALAVQDASTRLVQDERLRWARLKSLHYLAEFPAHAEQAEGEEKRRLVEFAARSREAAERAWSWAAGGLL